MNSCEWIFINVETKRWEDEFSSIHLWLAVYEGQGFATFLFCYYLNRHKGFHMQDKTLLKCKYEVTLNYPV